MNDNRRAQLITDIKAAIADKKSEHDILAAAVKLIDEFSPHFNWTGFYMLKGEMLHVGPYIGPVTEHTIIPLNAGICGAAASQKQSVMVDDVREDSRFIACSVSTRSEIVVPIMDGERVLGEIDIDSDQVGYFTQDDRLMLEQVADIIAKRLVAIGF